MTGITVEQVGHGVIYAGTLAAALTGIGAFLHFALVRPMRGFLRKEIVGNLVEIKDALEQNTSETEALKHMLEDHIANGGHLTH